MVQLYGTSLQRRYSSSACSSACCVRVLSLLILLILPYFLAFTSHSFWLKESVHYEQPSVLFKHDAIVLARATSSEGTTRGVIFSAADADRFVSEGHIRPSLTRVTAADVNADGKADHLDIKMTLPLEKDEKIYHVSGLFVLEYMLQERARVMFETAAFIDYGNPVAGTALEIDGDLVLKQRHALPYSGSFRKLYGDDPLLPTSNERNLVFRDVLRRYSQRNITTAFEAYYPLWTPSTGDSDTSHPGQTFDISVRVRIPAKQAVLYLPAVSEMLKFAWLQYLGMFVIVGIVVEICVNFIFRYQVVDTTVTVDRLQNGPKLHQF